MSGDLCFNRLKVINAILLTNNLKKSYVYFYIYMYVLRIQLLMVRFKLNSNK